MAGPAQLGERLSVLGAIFPAPPHQAHNSLWSLGSHRVTTGSQMWPIWNLLPTLLALTGLVATAWALCLSLLTSLRQPCFSLSFSLLVPLSDSTPLRLPYPLAVSVALPTMCLAVPHSTYQVLDFGLEHLFPCLHFSPQLHLSGLYPLSVSVGHGFPVWVLFWGVLGKSTVHISLCLEATQLTCFSGKRAVVSDFP